MGWGWGWGVLSRKGGERRGKAQAKSLTVVLRYVTLSHLITFLDFALAGRSPLLPPPLTQKPQKQDLKYLRPGMGRDGRARIFLLRDLCGEGGLLGLQKKGEGEKGGKG